MYSKQRKKEVEKKAKAKVVLVSWLSATTDGSRSVKGCWDGSTTVYVGKCTLLVIHVNKPPLEEKLQR
jgi:hypothetical protein